MDGENRFYSQKAIAIATFFGGPLAAGVLIRRNFINLGKEKPGLVALFAGVICTILLILIPDSIFVKYFKTLIPFVITGIIYLIVEKIQGKELKQHEEEKSEFYSNWRAGGIGIMCGAILFGCIFSYGYFSMPTWDADTYDAELEKFNNNEREAMKLFDLLDYGSDRQIAYFIEQIGIPKWKENIEILNGMNLIENLPEKFKKQNGLLLEYSRIRVEAYELIQKAVLQGSSEYDEEIARRHMRIDEIIKEL